MAMQDFKGHIQRKTLLRRSKQRFQVRPRGKNALDIIPRGRRKREVSYVRTSTSAQESSPTFSSILPRVVIALGSFAFLGFVTIGILWQLPDFVKQPLQNIHYSPTKLLTPELIYQSVHIDPKTPLLDLNIKQFFYELRQHPVVESLQLRLLLPNHLFLEIREAVPSTNLRVGSTYYLLDQHQRPIQQMDQPFPGLQPVLAMTSFEEMSLGAPLQSSAVKQGIELIELLEKSHFKFDFIKEINTDDPFNLKLELRDPPVQLHLGSDSYVERIQLFQKAYPLLPPHPTPIKSVDVTQPGRILVRFEEVFP